MGYNFVSNDIQSFFDHNTINVLSAIINCVDSGIVAAKTNGSFTIWNDAAKKLLGKTNANIVIEEWTKYYGCYHSDETMKLLTTEELPLVRAMTGEDVITEIFVKNEYQDGIWIMCKAAPIIVNGNIIGGVIVMRDNSDAHNLKKTLEMLKNSCGSILSNLSEC